jgi:Fe-S oxidoreductase/nitrate reductase gamma subunit
LEPSRQIFWNIQYGWIIYIIAAIAVGFMVYAFYRRYKIWHLGKPDARLTSSLTRRWKSFFNTALVDGIVHRKFIGAADNLGHRPLKFGDLLPREIYPGFAHFLIATGCWLLLLGTALDVISHYVYDFILGNFYFAHSMFTDIGGIMALIGVILVFVRRYGLRPERLDNRTEDLTALLAIIIIVITGFVLEGLRIAADEIALYPSWSVWSPGGYVLALGFRHIGHDTLIILHRSMWWFHSALVFGALFYIAAYFNRLWHIIVSPLNVFFRNLGARGAMVPIDLETAGSFGASRVEDYSWKHLLDLDACTRCGRCTDNCPAHLTGKPLNPKMILQDLKGNLLEKAPALLKSRAAQTAQPEGKATEEDNEGAEPKRMIGDVISIDAIWNCTTCFACQEVCPVWAEPMGKINEMRRNLVLEQASIPETAEGALRSIEDRGHPWRGTLLSRTSWFEGLGVKTLSEDSQIDILFWVGCTEALEERSLKVAQSISKLLEQAKINFGVLGAEESCCGDPARRLGNEYLYQMQAQKNIELLKSYNVKKIMTACPHCYNTLKNEYPQFGGDFEVIHHSEYLLQLLKEGKLKAPERAATNVCYHDACYLGRYNNIYEAPRQLLNSIPGIAVREMSRSRERSFCCGAGGGHLWLEEQKVGERINVVRTDQALAAQAEVVATACPYCLQMFEDGIKTREVEESLRAMDISELLAKSGL